MNPRKHKLKYPHNNNSLINFPTIVPDILDIYIYISLSNIESREYIDKFGGGRSEVAINLSRPSTRPNHVQTKLDPIANFANCRRSSRLIIAKRLLLLRNSSHRNYGGSMGTREISVSPSESSGGSAEDYYASSLISMADLQPAPETK